MGYQLLDRFQATFEGRRYRHRDSTLGDKVASYLYEDLFTLGKSTSFCERVSRQERVVNRGNLRRGIKARRGDGTFGELIPHLVPAKQEGFVVARGQIATVEIGCEVKILAKAMVKQITRVINDLRDQVEQFKRGAGQPICVGVVGINHAATCTSYERNRAYRTDGKGNRHPHQEAPEVESRLIEEAKPSFDEFLILKYRATNTRPYPFEWVDLPATQLDYGAILTRVSREYDHRFGGAGLP